MHSIRVTARGSEFAKAAEKLCKFLGGAQDHLSQMISHREDLDFLHDKFIQWQSKSKVGVLSYAESRSLFSDRILARVIEIGIVVDRISANPNIAGSSVKDLDSDHISLVKPMSKTDDIYAGTLRFIRDRLHDRTLSQMPSSEEAAEAHEWAIHLRPRFLTYS